MTTLENGKSELSASTGEIVLYQPDDTVRLEVMVEGETVWLSQAQMSTLFDRDRTVIGRHIRNIFKEGELQEDEVCAKFAHTTQHGALIGKTQTADILYYNLDVIISVGYRVKSIKGTAFRRWATKALKQYMLKGYAFNQRIERTENFAIETNYRVNEVENKLNFLVKYIEAVFADYNDINEDTRMQLELINQTLAELQSKNRWIDRPRIGYKRQSELDEENG